MKNLVLNSAEMYELRKYQKSAVTAAVFSMCSTVKNKPWLLVLPTGSGKSLVIANLIRHLPWKTIVLQPSKEILEQNYEKFMSYTDEKDVWIYSASCWKKDIKFITFAMIGSIIKKKELFSDFKNIIIDEAHLVSAKGWMYEELISHLSWCNIVWLTATPYRLASNSYGAVLRLLTRSRPKIFHEILYISQVKELKDEWYLSDMEYYEIWGFDSEKIKSNSTWAEFQDESLKNYLSEISFDKKLQNIVERLLVANRKSILVFTRFVADAQRLVNNVPWSVIVTWETPKLEREEILGKFKSGEIKVVANVNCLSIGFDYPELETIVLARPTKSLALYYQQVGRGIRPHKDKKSCWVVDMCENIKRFWHVEDLHLGKDKKGLYQITSNWKPLTNVYYK